MDDVLEFSCRKRSGLNSNGAARTSVFLCSPMVETPAAMFFGTKYPSVTSKHKKSKTATEIPNKKKN